MKEALTNLLKLKSIVTVLLTGLFIFCAVSGLLRGADVLAVYTMIIGFYFGVQSKKEV